MQAFEQQLREAGYLAMGGQIVRCHAWCPAPKAALSIHPRTREAAIKGRQVSQADLARQAEQGPTRRTVEKTSRLDR